jgi:hypothetical protein
MAAAVVAVTVVLLAPGMFDVLHAVSDLNETLRRVLWVVPFPVVVGLLAALPPPDRVVRRVGRPVVLLPAALLAAILVAFGRPLWISHEGPSSWTSSPSWKVRAQPMTRARAILARYHGDGAILARPKIMRSIAIVTAEPKAVNPRTLYALRTREPRARTRERLLLTSFVQGSVGRARLADVERALADLEVGLVCVPQRAGRVVRSTRALDGFLPAFRAERQSCFERGNAPSG